MKATIRMAHHALPVHTPANPVGAWFFPRELSLNEIVMRKRNIILTLVAGGLSLAATNLMAQGTADPAPAADQTRPSQYERAFKKSESGTKSSTSSCLKASTIIGREVYSAAGDRLAKVSDLIVSLDAQSVPIAILAYGGALGIGETRVAVPVKDLKWTGEPQHLTMAATRGELESASPVATGGWAVVARDDWTKRIDHFYGQPPGAVETRFERQEMSGAAGVREPVRAPFEEKGAATLEQGKQNQGTQPMDLDLMIKVNEIIGADLGAEARNVKATVSHGAVTLKGKVASEEQKRNLETQIKAVTGVNEVDDQLEIGSE
jgi:hypothetical protein